MSFDPTHPRATPVVEELDATAPRPDPWLGRVIDGRYRLESRLATGGMGEVFKATHVELGRTLALKMMRAELSNEASFVERFRREAMTSSRLGHPNIVDIIDSGRMDSGEFYFVMEFLDGEPLSALIAKGPVAPPQAIDLVLQMAEALESAHRAGVVHRDLKPDNAIVVQRGGKPFVKLVDFGIAKVVTPLPNQKQTTHGVIMGTPQYMAPEQAAGVALDARADIYALGLILFELLTGKPPLTGATAPLVMSAHISEPAPPLGPQFPPKLRDVVARMLAKRPGDRPESMVGVIDALRAALDERPVRGARWPVAGFLVVGVLVVGAGVAVWQVARSEPSPPPAPATPPQAAELRAVVPTPPPPPPVAESPVVDAGAVTPVEAAEQPVARPTKAPAPAKQKSPASKPAPAKPAAEGIIKEYPSD